MSRSIVIREYFHANTDLDVHGRRGEDGGRARLDVEGNLAARFVACRDLAGTDRAIHEELNVGRAAVSVLCLEVQRVARIGCEARLLRVLFPRLSVSVVQRVAVKHLRRRRPWMTEFAAKDLCEIV